MRLFTNHIRKITHHHYGKDLNVRTAQAPHSCQSLSPIIFLLATESTLKQPDLVAFLRTKKEISKHPGLVITVTARLTELQVISEGVHELAASLGPAGSVGDGGSVVVGLLV